MQKSMLRIGIAGMGVVGQGVIQILQQHHALIAKRAMPIEVKAVSARDASKARDIDISAIRFYTDALDLAKDPEIDVVVELIGGAEGIAKMLCKQALLNGKHIVTANKALLASYGIELAQLAAKTQTILAFEAAVAGGIPVIKTLREGLAANRISEIQGILNGTCNYILTDMEASQRSFQEVLKEAQSLGYAEADPTFDIDGIDTAHKLAILSALAFGTKIELNEKAIKGIRTITTHDIMYAKELGYRIKLLGTALQKSEGIWQNVGPWMVPSTHPLANVPGPQNAIQLQGDMVGPSFLQGEGAGRGPTASAVVADLIDIANHRMTKPFMVATEHLAAAPLVNNEQAMMRYYLRFEVSDITGVLADISAILRQLEVSVEIILQKPHKKEEPAQIVMTTHRTSHRMIEQAIEQIKLLPTLIASPQMIPIM